MNVIPQEVYLSTFELPVINTNTVAMLSSCGGSRVMTHPTSYPRHFVSDVVAALQLERSHWDFTPMHHTLSWSGELLQGQVYITQLHYVLL
jgi:hypothetical protein